MKLYYLPGACPLAAHIVMEWTGQSYESQEVSREELKQEAYLKLNPVGSVPVLIDGDFVLTQCSAILEYLADLHPQSGLLPDNVRGRAEVRRWLAFCNADIHKLFGMLFSTQKYATTPAAQEELMKNASAALVNLFGIANKQLEGKQWLTGQRSLADAYLYVLLRWAAAKNLPLENYNHLQAFYKHMDADAGVQAALKAEGLV